MVRLRLQHSWRSVLKNKLLFSFFKRLLIQRCGIFIPCARPQQITYFRNRHVTMIAFSSETASYFSSVNFPTKTTFEQNVIKCIFSGSSGTIFREILIDRLSFTWCRAEVGSIVQILHRWAWSELFSLSLLRVLPYLWWWSMNYR